MRFTVGADLIASNAIGIDRIPSGLTAKAMLLNDSTIELYFTGNALDHAVDTNILVTFKDAAFTNGGKADSIKNTTTSLAINWVNMYTVASAGGDFTTIQSALDSINDADILHIKEGVYTEYNLGSTLKISNLTLLGDGPDKTVIQADTLPFMAKGRVFSLNALKNIYLEGITIQNGNITDGNARGGGIKALFAHIELVNCRIINNRAFSTGKLATFAGGITSQSINVKNCEFSGNICDNEAKSPACYGGAIQTIGYGTANKIENSTFANNYARRAGGAYFTYGPLEVVNSTFKGNSTADSAGANATGGRSAHMKFIKN